MKLPKVSNGIKFVWKPPVPSDLFYNKEGEYLTYVEKEGEKMEDSKGSKIYVKLFTDENGDKTVETIVAGAGGGESGINDTGSGGGKVKVPDVFDGAEAEAYVSGYHNAINDLRNSPDKRLTFNKYFPGLEDWFIKEHLGTWKAEEKPIEFEVRDTGGFIDSLWAEMISGNDKWVNEKEGRTPVYMTASGGGGGSGIEAIGDSFKDKTIITLSERFKEKESLINQLYLYNESLKKLITVWGKKCEELEATNNLLKSDLKKVEDGYDEVALRRDEAVTMCEQLQAENGTLQSDLNRTKTGYDEYVYRTEKELESALYSQGRDHTQPCNLGSLCPWCRIVELEATNIKYHEALKKIATEKEPFVWVLQLFAEEALHVKGE